MQNSKGTPKAKAVTAKTDLIAELAQASPADLKEDLQTMFKLVLGAPGYTQLPALARENMVESYFILAGFLDRVNYQNKAA